MSTTDQTAARESGAAIDDAPPYRYSAAVANEIEPSWQARWASEGTFNAPNPSGRLADGFDRVAIRPHSYVMDMFPYPSGAGLHIGLWLLWHPADRAGDAERAV